jgi:hypothetical protein
MKDRLRHFYVAAHRRLREHRGEFHHRDAEGTKLREDNEIGPADVANQLDGRSALHNHFHGLKDFVVVLGHGRGERHAPGGDH